MAAAGAAAVHGERFSRQLSRPHWEDFRFFRHNRAHVQSLPDCFTSPPAWPGLYRPLSTSCYYYAGRRLFDNSLAAYHVLNLALFVGNAALLGLLARALLPGGWWVVVTLAFSTRLAHAPLLVTTSEAQALLSTAFALAALAVAVGPREQRWRDGAAPLLFLAALLSKETVVVLPAILMAWDRGRGERPRWRRLAGLLAAAAVWAALLLLARHREGDAPTGFTYDVSAAAVPRLAAYLLSVLNPLAAGPAQVEMPEAVVGWAFAPLAMGAVVALVAAAAEVLRRAPRLQDSPALRAWAIGIAWFVAGAAPFLFFADRLFMRYAYFAHAGLAIAAAAAAAGAVGAVRDARRRARPASAGPAAP